MAGPCSSAIVSPEYGDFIVEYAGQEEALRLRYAPDCYETVGSGFAIIHKRLPEDGRLDPDKYDHAIIPHLLGLLDTTSMEESGILSAHQSPGSGYLGTGVIVGIVDTGIDYTHPAFRYPDGASRVLAIWDQSGTDGAPPEGFAYGSVYGKDMIDRALAERDPLSVVPEEDMEGHGTFLAGIAAGSASEDGTFIGAAPGAHIAVVRLKQAKDYLRQYYFIPDGTPAYQENDVMAGVAWLVALSRERRQPLVICLGIGCSLSSHDGSSKLCRYLSDVNDAVGCCVVTAAGNELGRAHHASGQVDQEKGYRAVELRVDEGENGFQMELWGASADVFSVEIVSPGGEVVRRGSSGLGQSQTTELLSYGTRIYVGDKTAQTEGGQFLMVLRFTRPEPGIWTLRVYADRMLSGRFDIWLPMEKFIRENTYFLEPDPDKTLVTTATAPPIIAAAAWNHYNGGLYIHSGRGFTADGSIKPDLAAPGVNVYGPFPGGGYGTKSGTSVAAAHAAGAAALLMEWGIYGRYVEDMDGNDIRRLLIRGAVRSPVYVYPDRGWGYGILDLQNTFESLRNVL